MASKLIFANEAVPAFFHASFFLNLREELVLEHLHDWSDDCYPRLYQTRLQSSLGLTFQLGARLIRDYVLFGRSEVEVAQRLAASDVANNSPISTIGYRFALIYLDQSV